MENISEVNEDITFNTLKYRRYTSNGIWVNDIWIHGGTTYWVNDAGELHRENGPAVEFISGAEWYRNGLRHREGGPAIEFSDGTKYWYRNGEYTKNE